MDSVHIVMNIAVVSMCKCKTHSDDHRLICKGSLVEFSHFFISVRIGDEKDCWVNFVW